MERFIVVLLFFSVTSCQSLINEEIILEGVQKPDEIQDIIEIKNKIEPELVWDHLKKNAKNRIKKYFFLILEVDLYRCLTFCLQKWKLLISFFYLIFYKSFLFVRKYKPQ